ncbi:MAG: Unknown protein [uncultured Thiotrichaceae bacterium]|uniref:LPS export ABC transporter periplasmic protein LptC n=1 Tax=uncultured Thiotrichaceae bacterium TaxID=298394 RepID=A0A6S6TG63_9GAMM|nr:MAG: Unknown protein [uncultured Thiotrichaceae bacterium]
MFRFNGLIFLILACIIAIAGTWLNRLWQEQQQFTEKLDRSQIDYYLSDFSLISTDTNGQAQFILSGDHFIHRREKKESEIYNPAIIIHSEGESLSIHAEEARHFANEDMELMGSVSISKPESENLAGYELRTSNLKYSPSMDRLSTEQALSLNSTDNAEISGIGLIHDLKNEVIQIQDKVHAEYLPNN